MQNTTPIPAKFPTRGKLLDFFIKVLEIEKTNDADRKRYQRFVSELEISVEEYNETLAICIDDITEELFPLERRSYAKQKIKYFLAYYLEIIRTIEVYAHNQVDINSVLSEYIFLPFISFLYNDYLKLFPYNDKKQPQQNLWEMFQNKLDIDEPRLKKELFNFLDNATNNLKSDKTLEENIRNWLTGEHFPNKDYREYLSEFLSKKISHFSKDEINSLFIIANVLKKISHPSINPILKQILFSPRNEETPIKFLSISPVIFQQSSNKNMHQILDNATKQSLHYLNSKIENKRPWLPKRIKKHTTELFYVTDIDRPKEIGMLERFENTIRNMEKSKSIDIHKNPFISLTQARLYAQQKDFKKSTEYYLKALKDGKNSMGLVYKEVIKEGLIVSSQATRQKLLDLKNANSPFVKFYKEAYFLKFIGALPDEIYQYFLNDMKKKFYSYFGYLYPNQEEVEAIEIARSSGLISANALDKIKLDLKNPDKWIRTKYPNPVTQLMHFSLTLDYARVKKLLDIGADANITRFNDNGTALTMVLSKQFDDEKRTKAIKIAQLLISNMSTEILCVKLPKTKMTALGLAIDLGYLSIVKQLLTTGVDINERISPNQVSPLYYTLQKINESKINLTEYKERLNIDNNVDRLKVVNSMPANSFFYTNAITDQEKIETFKNIQSTINKSPKQQQINTETAKYFWENTRSLTNNYYEIFDLLLDAQPDLEIRFNYDKNTILMFATELKEIAIVKKLLAAGADINATINDTRNPHKTFTAKDYAIKGKDSYLINLLN